MAKQLAAVLKSYFETGDMPTASQFADLIDSFSNLASLDSDNWRTLKILYSDLTGFPGAACDISLEDIPAGCYLEKAVYILKTTFGGGSISAVQFYQYVDSVSPFSCFNFNINNIAFIDKFMSFPHMLDESPFSFNSVIENFVRFELTGDNLANLSQGEIWVFYKFNRLPDLAV